MPSHKIIVRPQNHWKYVTYLALIRNESILPWSRTSTNWNVAQQRLGRFESHGYWMWSWLVIPASMSLRWCWRRTFWAHDVIKMTWC